MELERISQLLSSDDIELVQLGAVLLQNAGLPKEWWSPILHNHQQKKGEEDIQTGTFWHPYKWTYVIDEAIVISPVPEKQGNGLYNQLNGGYNTFVGHNAGYMTTTGSNSTVIGGSTLRRGTTIRTGQGGMNLITGAIKNYLNQQQTNIYVNNQKTKAKTSSQYSKQRNARNAFKRSGSRAKG